jgi:hypothetical protein
MRNHSRGQAIPADPHEWRPQSARRGRRMPEIHDPIVEPLWDGIHVIAHFRAEQDGLENATLELIDTDGEEVSHVAPGTALELSRAIMALDAVVDGVLTPQATADSTGISMVASTHVPATSLIIPHKPEVTHEPRRGAQTGEELAFVAVDLLSVDGQLLLDLPLLERKRQLESLLIQSELVRVSVYTRPPVKPWLSSWKSAGFRGVVLKAANSRYRPGDETTEWAVVSRESQA